MVGTIACSIGAALLDVFSFTLLIPFLNSLFNQPPIAGDNKLAEALQRLIGGLIAGRDGMAALQIVILLILMAIVSKNLLVWIGGQLNAQLQELVTRDIRNDVYRHLARLPLSYFLRTKAGQILSRVLTDTAQTKTLLTYVITHSVQSFALVTSYITALFLISWRLTLLALVVVPLLIGLLQPLLKKLRAGYRRIGNEHGEMTSVVQEVVNGIRLVKAFGAEPYEEQRFVEASGRYSRQAVRVTRIAFLAQPITEVVGTLIIVAILWVGARQVLVSQALPGAQLILFLTLVMRLLAPLKQLSQIPTTAQQSLAAAERLAEMLDQKTEAQLDAGAAVPAEFRRDVVFENVRFAYADEPVLSDVSFTARKGQVVALVGPSGAGKTTLVDLIPRFYEPTGGRILLDGVDTRGIALAALRGLTGIVSQDTVLFHDTVRNNIAYGANGKYSDAQIRAAAEAANAHEFIERLPEKYDTILGERGTRLSGGQRQRIAIARALLVDPPILILDEATSALDTESERLVQEAIDRLLANRTVFVIAHRLSTIEHADQILVLERGRVVEQGRHAELLKRNGVYARLHQMQFRPPRGGVPSAAT